jgi:serine protease Do
MNRQGFWSAVLGALLAFGVLAPAFGAMTPPKGSHWLAVASARDKDVAIGIAGIYADAGARVVTSTSGWYGVVLGPYREDSVAAIVAAHGNIGDIPKDALLSQGGNYIESVWNGTAAVGQTAPLKSYQAGDDATLTDGSLQVKVSMTGDESNPGPTRVDGKIAGSPAFYFETSADFSMGESSAGIVRLDGGTPFGQVVYNRFTGGAHCCTQTWVIAQSGADGHWGLLDLGQLDGGGPAFEDLDGDGAAEIVSVDNRFLYAFASYAESLAPMEIFQLRDGRIIDVSKEPAFRSKLVQELARFEFFAKLDPSLWKSNGFLAGWAAAKLRLGQGSDAWETLQENADRQSDFGPQSCRTGGDVGECAGEDLERVPVLKAMAQFLTDLDYGELPLEATALLN